MIVIPMAGMSSRFFKAGYQKPKYMLEAHGETLFEHSVKSFEKYFKTIPFLFVVKDVFNTPLFVENKAKELGIKNFYISTIYEDTRGQGETVALGLKDIISQGVDYQGPLTIFNIDTFRPNFEFPSIINESDGYLEVFIGEGSNWSFAKPKNAESTEVIQTAEKKPISNLCSTGLYYFRDVSMYLDAYASYLELPESQWEKGEIYIAPMYNYLIKNGRKIRYNKISSEDVIFCGVPDEYEQFKNI